jgi:alpha,alpha-trehalase
MDGSDALTADRPVHKRVVRSPEGHMLNRYWDSLTTPRPEAFQYESKLASDAEQQGIEPKAMHTHLRAACESGWDFSSRWFTDGKTLVTTTTADMVPVDLNCLLYSLEKTLEAAYRQAGKQTDADAFSLLADQRKTAVLATCWNNETGFFHDYHIPSSCQTQAVTLAGVFPLYMNLATPDQAIRVHSLLSTSFLQTGGWVTTLERTGQQWDWPNGWAPLQWIVYKGLMNYGYAETARAGQHKWLAHNDKVFKATGKMMEKYNVVDAALTTGGGKYPNQDGFGWTNGVYLALLKEHD